jgi:hypothetical protein
MHDSVSVQVMRSSESWQFFAFVFAAVFGLTISLLDEVDYLKKHSSWVRMAAKLVLFAGCFYIFMVNDWMRNHCLVYFLNWLKVEHY